MASSSSRVPGGSASKPAAKAGTSASNRSGRSSERAVGAVSEAWTVSSSSFASTLTQPKASQKGKAWAAVSVAPLSPSTSPENNPNGLEEGPVSSRLRRVPGRPLSKTAYAISSTLSESLPLPSSRSSSAHTDASAATSSSPERKRGRYADSPRRGLLRPNKKFQPQPAVVLAVPSKQLLPHPEDTEKDIKPPLLRRTSRTKSRLSAESDSPIRTAKKKFASAHPENNKIVCQTRSQKGSALPNVSANQTKVKEEPGSDSSTDSEPVPSSSGINKANNNQGKAKVPPANQNSSAKGLAPPPRVSSRTKPSTTGSCASRSRRASRAGFASLPSDQRGMSGQEAVPGPSHAPSSANPGPSSSSASGNSNSGAAAAGGAAANAGLVADALGGVSGGGAVAGSVLLSAGAAANALGMSADSESDDNEMGRLQALLEARGLPPHLFGALGPRMQHFLHRSMGSSTTSKAHQLLAGLQCTGDEGQQLQAVIEMCQLLVMGNEDTLAGFPVKQVVPALITLLHLEHNFDIMNHACRALTYMMEALPRSSAVVVDAIPAFLEKLQVIQCMDVAEQSLTALEMLSRRHSKSILQAKGVAACLMYLDFFSVNAQRSALSITANCCQNLHADEFHYVEESLALLAARLTQHDKKSVESVCLAFSRLVDSFQSDAHRLQEIASTELLANLQQLLVVSPPIMSTGTFIMVIRMMSIMCAHCPELAVKLLKQNIAHTLCYLLTGPTGEAAAAAESVELVARSPQELYEITSLIGELMPRLPTEGLFCVDALLLKPSVVQLDAVLWQWRDDRGLWHPYSAIDSRIVEAAHQSGEDEISLSTMGRTYTLDFHSMQQINDETGTTRPVQRKVNHVGGVCPAGGTGSNLGSLGLRNSDSRIECLRADGDLASNFIRALFSVLYEVYSSSAGPAVRHKCLRAVLRMLFYATPQLLQDVLKNQQVSSHLAGMLSSQDLKIVVGALQMAHILMGKLADIFGVQFRREGVVYQVQRLADPNTVLGTSTNSSSHLSGAASISAASSSGLAQDNPGPSHSAMTAALNGHMSAVVLSAESSLENAEEMEEQSLQAAAAPSAQSRFGDVLKRKRGGKKSSATGGRKTRPEGQPEPGKVSPLLESGKEKDGVKAKHSLSGSVGGLNGGKTSSFLASLNPARWGRSHTAPSTPPSVALPDRVYKSESCPLPKMLSNPHLAGNREKVKTWIREQAAAFLITYFSNEARLTSSASADAENLVSAIADVTVLDRLTAATRKLQANPGLEVLEEIREIVLHTDISSFEVIHSGLVPALTAYLTDEGPTPFEREQRIRTFLHVYLGCPLDALSLESPRGAYPPPLQSLVAKLNACVNQLEQFPVRVHDLPGSAPGGGAMRSGVSALKFFYTHQLKCNLQRYPSCNTLKQWKGGAVKIDPLALVQAIEKYLVIRGYGRLRDKDAGDSEDDNSEEDIDDTLAAVMMNQGTMRHKLQFLINEHVIPYNMTVYEAVRQFGLGAHLEQSETDTDNEAPVGSASIWVHTHTIYYRPVPDGGASGASTSASAMLSCSGGGATSSQSASSSRKGKGGAKQGSKKKGDELWNEGVAPESQSPLSAFWMKSLPESVSVEDPSLPLLNLLRILHALNRHWSSLYLALPHEPLLPPQEFLSAKLTAKANRQLQDPLVIMTGNLPAWLQQITLACPFLFPLDTRQLLFYATSFDRDRALQRLVDSVPELSHGDSQERVTPRLDRRKRTVSREDILKQAEQVLQDLGSSRALLEIQYENEVGTGLGPTLEFYALVSRELQRADLDLWRGGAVQDYVHHSAGLFPSPLPRNLKVAQLTRVRSKFRFLGKFMAKAIMDSRMLDLPFSLSMYRWLLGHEQELTGADLKHVEPELYKTYLSLSQVLAQKRRLEANLGLTTSERGEKIANLTLDGCSIEDLGLDFTIPGIGQIEMRRNGKDIPVTIHNLEHYLRCLSHWLLVEGVSKQMEALREGFESVFPLAQLSVFYPEELELVLCGAAESGVASEAERWDAQALLEAWKPDHGYTVESKPFRYLAQVLSTYTRSEQRKFLQFVTGSPRLPVGGFKSLSPPLTVVRKTVEANQHPDDFLPSVMTCVNYLKLPDYSSIEILREKLRVATQEGLDSFHLS